MRGKQCSRFNRSRAAIAFASELNNIWGKVLPSIGFVFCTLCLTVAQAKEGIIEQHPVMALPMTSIELPKDVPVKIEVELTINRIYAVDTTDASFKIDGYYILGWKDKRVSALLESYVVEKKMFLGSIVDTLLEEHIWNPDLEFLNNLDTVALSNQGIELHKNGQVFLKKRFHGKFVSNMNFRKYPFDSQSIEIHIESFSYDITDLVFNQPDADAISELIDEQSLTEWWAETPIVSVSEIIYPAGDVFAEERYSRHSTIVKMHRLSNYYIWNVFFPLFLIIAASWVIFWLKDFGQELGTGFTLMLTVVSFSFYTSTLLPKLPYTTFIGAVVTSGYAAIFMSILLVVVSNFIYHRGYQNSANRLLKTCRWLFPLGYVMALLFIVNQFMW